MHEVNTQCIAHQVTPWQHLKHLLVKALQVAEDITDEVQEMNCQEEQEFLAQLDDTRRQQHAQAKAEG